MPVVRVDCEVPRSVLNEYIDLLTLTIQESGF